MSRSAKGGQFERDLCRTLSLWWTGGKRDDVYWRTSGSGARSTQRSKQGKKTFGQAGDIQAVDPIGQPLLDLLTIEAKKGYSGSTPFDAVDAPTPYAQGERRLQLWEKFVTQAQEEAKEAEVPFWALIHQRTSRKAVIFIPFVLYHLLESQGAKLQRIRPWLLVETRERVAVWATLLEEFLRVVRPQDIQELNEWMVQVKNGKRVKLTRRG